MFHGSAPVTMVFCTMPPAPPPVIWIIVTVLSAALAT